MIPVNPERLDNATNDPCILAALGKVFLSRIMDNKEGSL